MQDHSSADEKVSIGNYLSLGIAIVFFSGLLKSNEWWGVLDFTTLNGSFGSLINSAVSDSEGVISTTMANYRGKGGSGALDGFMFALGLVPTCMFALGMVRIFEHFGALVAARKLLTPVLRLLMGIPGVSGLTMIASLQNTDTGASMTKSLVEKGEMSRKEMHIFSAFQFSCGASIVNFMGSGAVLLTLVNSDGTQAVPASIGMILGVIFICKIFGANVMRVYLNHLERKGSYQEQAKEAEKMEAAHV